MTDTQDFAEITSRSTAELAEKYLALWNEPDADRRRRMIAELWTEDGRHVLQPPQEIRAIAAQPGHRPDGDPRGTGTRGDRGSRGERVRALGRLRGAQLPGARRRRRLGDVVKFHWEAVAKDGELVAVGLDFLVLAADGRIERDYTFVVA